ncbi:hypothetical protein PL9631_560041 [Planktothrix paucivesiculata PCC 9631]|uniref:Uncharacterized protein n=1 Tax=Planktothrix paucivesiculata PCC 9631 TaxID=671071 RepID=A0A7Z9E3E4_9CYAN|nr:hypothetical protein PL9631_560041 [Planktothrix paucivesiculata PCC 9631]
MDLVLRIFSMICLKLKPESDGGSDIDILKGNLLRGLKIRH